VYCTDKPFKADCMFSTTISGLVGSCHTTPSSEGSSGTLGSNRLQEQKINAVVRNNSLFTIILTS
jgi:hypothetical protein